MRFQEDLRGKAISKMLVGGVFRLCPEDLQENSFDADDSSVDFFGDESWRSWNATSVVVVVVETKFVTVYLGAI